MRKRASVHFRLLETALARWMSPLPADKLSHAAIIDGADLLAVVNVALFPYAWVTRNKGKGVRYELDP